MAKAMGVSQSSVVRIWRAFALQPHRQETFKLSADPLFTDKVRDVVGLYLNPPTKAIVLCVDEKSQIQALDRTQPLLPMMPGVPERRNPRLQAPRHHHALCGSRRCHEQGPRRAAPPPSRQGVPEVLADHRCERAQEPRRASDDGQLRHA
jgi:hypothetical protein